MQNESHLSKLYLPSFIVDFTYSVNYKLVSFVVIFWIFSKFSFSLDKFSQVLLMFSIFCLSMLLTHYRPITKYCPAHIHPSILHCPTCILSPHTSWTKSCFQQWSHLNQTIIFAFKFMQVNSPGIFVEEKTGRCSIQSFSCVPKKPETDQGKVGVSLKAYLEEH